ncbi:isoaspartyl peptidase/L-asparaginase-like isoform X4 [Periplaneta americana]|uniref:isoaspartyl peptidase/L-asparaginase-like isoform X4 n=2 Tax=Periplaneta americana TaxID=6978 RepID=UPI0037E8B014
MNRCKIWIKACDCEYLFRNVKDINGSMYRVCSLHFPQEMIKSTSKVSRLTADAVPVLNLPGFQENTAQPASSEMVQPVMLVHGGAGDIPDNRVQQKIDGVCRAAKKGYAVLTSGGSVIDAVQAAVQVMEDDEAFNAGYGSVLNEDGEVEMDAIVMEGRDLKTGAVGAIKNVAHPVDVARLVMEKTPHVLLVGEGAKKFANDQGIPDVPVGYLVTKFAKQSLAQIKSGNGTPTSELGGVGTVGAVAVDTDGHLAVATSTGGTSGKMVGRVGDTPLPGCGGFADDDVGAVSTTGHGESIMRFCLAHTILELMKQGKFANEATKDACEAMTERVGDTAGAITLSNKGEVGISFTSRRMAWAYVTGENICYGIEQNDETCENVKSCKRGK